MKKNNAASFITYLIGVWLLYGCIAMGIEIPQPYTVTQGDTLYELSGFKLGDPNMWKQVVEKNPFLKEKGRMFLKADGTVVVIIKPNEKIMGLEGVVTPQLLSESEITKYLNVQKTPVAPQTPQANPESTTTTNFTYGLFFITVVAVLLFLTALAVAMRDFLAPNGVAFFGKPMRSWLKRFLRLAPSLTESLMTFERMRATEGGSLAEIYQVALFSFLPISTEFADGAKSIGYNGDLVYLGVFRNKNQEIIDVVLFAKYCLNGMLFDRMDTDRLRSIFTNSLRFQNAKRIATPSGYTGAENFEAVEAWLRNKYATATTNQETPPTSTTETSTSESSPATETITENDIQQLEKVTDKLDSVIAKIENAILGDISEDGEESKIPSTTDEEREGLTLVDINPDRKDGEPKEEIIQVILGYSTFKFPAQLAERTIEVDHKDQWGHSIFKIGPPTEEKAEKALGNESTKSPFNRRPNPARTAKQKEKDAQNYIANLKGTKRT